MIDFADVQGTVLRGYRVDLARHFVLSVTGVARARAFIGQLVDGTGGVPRITTAARWTRKPECFVNVGFTCAGLAALGVTPAELATFDRAFQRGATDPDSAMAVGDVGESAPANWIGGLADGARVHIVLNLWVHEDAAVLEKVSTRLRSAFAGALTELSAHDAQALPGNFVHFGYHDNIAQPTVDGAPPRKRPAPDDQPVVPTGEFLLGYRERVRIAVHRAAGRALDQQQLRGVPDPRAGRRRLRAVPHDERGEGGDRSASCWPRRCAAAGGTATRWSSRRTRPARRCR